MQVYNFGKVQIFICKRRIKKLGQITQEMDYSIYKNHFSKTNKCFGTQLEIAK